MTTTELRAERADGQSAELLDTPGAGPAAVRGGVLQTASWLGATVVGVASGAILVRYLGVIETGRYAVAIALIAIVSGIPDLGLGSISVREFSVLTGAASGFGRGGSF